MIRLFDVEGGVVIPTEHCYTIKYLKVIMDQYPEDYNKIYPYLFYMNCPNPDLNPYFDVPEDNKEELILRDIGATFDPDDQMIKEALEGCKLLYETTLSRAYTGIKIMLDNLATYLATTKITTGRDGNGPFLLNAAKSYDDIRASFKGAYKDLKEEQQSRVRGDVNTAYDQN